MATSRPYRVETDPSDPNRPNFRMEMKRNQICCVTQPTGGTPKAIVVRNGGFVSQPHNGVNYGSRVARLTLADAKLLASVVNEQSALAAEVVTIYTMPEGTAFVPMAAVTN